MNVGIGFVFELTREEPAALLGELDGLRHHAHPALRRRSQHHLGAQETHQLPPFDAEGLGHRHDQRIALLRAHHGETDAGVAAGRLDDGLPGLQLPGALGGLDDAERKPVLDRAQGVECLDLDEEVCIRGRQLVDLDYRRVAYRFKNIAIPASHAISPSAVPTRPVRRRPMLEGDRRRGQPNTLAREGSRTRPPRNLPPAILSGVGSCVTCARGANVRRRMTFLVRSQRSAATAA